MKRLIAANGDDGREERERRTVDERLTKTTATTTEGDERCRSLWDKRKSGWIYERGSVEVRVVDCEGGE